MNDRIPNSVVLLVKEQIQNLAKEREALLASLAVVDFKAKELRQFLSGDEDSKAVVSFDDVSGIDIAIYCLNLKGRAINRADIKEVIDNNASSAEEANKLLNRTSVALTTEKSRKEGRVKFFKVNGTEYFGLVEWFNADLLFKGRRPEGLEDVDIHTSEDIIRLTHFFNK